MKDNPVFTIRITVSGNLNSNYVFENNKEKNRWIKKDLVELEKQYGRLIIHETHLPGFKIGDTCRVVGEGLYEFKIESIKKYSKDRFGFGLDSGWYEEVAKCY